MTNKIYFLLLTLTFIQCKNTSKQNIMTSPKEYAKGTFGYDVNFLKQFHKDLVLLGDSAGAQAAIAPAYQGRVMTTTANGNDGKSFGWVNYDLIASKQIQPHMNAFGGEERFWLGPEGGQFSLYFKKDSEFKFDNWVVPKELDTEPFTLVNSNTSEAKFEKEMHLENYSGFKFDLKINRNIRLLPTSAISNLLKVEVPSSVTAVAFESENILTNIGQKPWSKSTGLLSVWILSMLNASDQGVIGLPFKKGDIKNLGTIVTDDYFGKIPPDRLKVKDGLIVFKADGNHRGKIGISPKRAQPWMCSYDAGNGVLTIAQYTLPEENTDYVNSLWALQKNPFAGDAANAYNDGPQEGGTQMGKFYELESSSPAAVLAPQESLTHIHRTIHFKGSPEQLGAILQGAFGVKISDLSF